MKSRDILISNLQLQQECNWNEHDTSAYDTYER